MGNTVLLDTSAFIMGYEVSDVDAEHYTVPAVQLELRKGGFPWLRLDTALRTNRLKMLRPENQYVEEVEKVALELGEMGVLSYADTELLALGLQLGDEGKNTIVVSDDYSVQNVADRLGLRYRGLATPGIKRRFEWAVYCPGCRRSFRRSQPGGLCPVCGTTLKRKPVKKRPAEGRVEDSRAEPGHEGSQPLASDDFSAL